jgi:hypothetical protein
MQNVVYTNCPGTCGLCNKKCVDASKDCKHWVSSWVI